MVFFIVLIDSGVVLLSLIMLMVVFSFLVLIVVYNNLYFFLLELEMNSFLSPQKRGINLETKLFSLFLGNEIPIDCLLTK